MSLSMIPFSWRIPQCPWLVYAHRQTSHAITRSGKVFLSSFTLSTTGPSTASAPLPRESCTQGKIEEKEKRKRIEKREKSKDLFARLRNSKDEHSPQSCSNQWRQELYNAVHPKARDAWETGDLSDLVLLVSDEDRVHQHGFGEDFLTLPLTKHGVRVTTVKMGGKGNHRIRRMTHGYREGITGFEGGRIFPFFFLCTDDKRTQRL